MNSFPFGAFRPIFTGRTVSFKEGNLIISYSTKPGKKKTSSILKSDGWEGHLLVFLRGE